MILLVIIWWLLKIFPKNWTPFINLVSIKKKLYCKISAPLKERCRKRRGYINNHHPSSLLTEFGLGKEIGKPRLSVGVVNCFHVHSYEHKFWDVDILAGPRGLKGCSRRKLMARPGTWGGGAKNLKFSITNVTRDHWTPSQGLPSLFRRNAVPRSKRFHMLGKNQGCELNSWSRRVGLNLAANDHKAAFQHLMTGQAWKGVEEQRSIKAMMPDRLT